MSTVNEREALRRALQIADGIEPRADGLQRIQARLRPPRPLAIAWAEAAWTYARMRGPAAVQEFPEWLLGVIGMVWERLAPRSRTSGGRALSSRTIGWLRPAAVAGATIAVVAVGTYVAIDGQQMFSPSASNSVHSNGGAPGSGGGTQGIGGTNAQSQSAFSPYGSSPSASPTCTATKPGGSAPPAPTTTPSSPAPSPSDTSSAPSPSPSPSDSSSPAASPTAQPIVPATAADVSAAGSTTAARKALTASLLQPQASASPKPTPCATKRPSHRTSSGSTPNPGAAVISFGKLDDGG